MNKGVQIAFATLATFAGLIWVVASGTSDQGTFRYYRSVGEYLVNPPISTPGAEQLRVHGFVVQGSIAKDLSAGHVDFAIADAEPGAILHVRLVNIDVPDLFRDGAEVVVEGSFEGQTFLAERVMAKCPSKYEAEVPGEGRT